MSDEITSNEHDEYEPLDESYRLYSEGVMACTRSEFEEAYKLLLASAELKAHGKTYERLHTVAKRMAKTEEAYLYIEQAYKLSSDNNKIASMYAEELLSHGKIEQAKSILKEILRRSATYGPARRLLNQIEGADTTGDK